MSRVRPTIRKQRPHAWPSSARLAAAMVALFGVIALVIITATTFGSGRHRDDLGRPDQHIRNHEQHHRDPSHTVGRSAAAAIRPLRRSGR